MTSAPFHKYNRLWSWVKPFAGLHLYIRALRGREERCRLSERFGHGYKSARPHGRLFWLHAVSVGESVAALTLAEGLRQLDPQSHILITTNTMTAATRIAEQGDDHIHHAYQPLDHPLWVDRFLDYWHPDYAVMLESDFWPNLISRTAKRQIPVAFASSQLSDKAYENWQRRPTFAAEIFGVARHIFAVDKHQSDRFKTLAGTSSGQHPKIHMSGSLKLNPASLSVDEQLVNALGRAADTSPILVAASTHKGEEEQILQASQTVQERGLNHLLIFAPRHPKRGAEILQIAAQAGLKLHRRSQGQWPQSGDKAYICDSLGEMGSLYHRADLILLGGSFVDLGGHNPLEVALFSTPIIAGPSRYKNQLAYDRLTQAGLIQCANSAEELAQTIETALLTLKAGHKLISADTEKQIAQITAEACESGKKTAQYLLSDLTENTPLNP